MAGRVAACDVTSSRPDVARRLLQGRRANEVLAALPRLFAICGVSQATAGALALAAAAGTLPDEDQLAKHTAAVRAETLRELAHRLLLDTARLLGERPSNAALAALRALQPGSASPPDSGTRAALATAVFGHSAADWLARDSAAALLAWAKTGTTPAAWRVAMAMTPVEATEPPIGLLTGAELAAGVAAWAPAAEDDPQFVHAPTWQGAAVETGPLARSADDPLQISLRAAGAPRQAQRLAARLRELAWLLVARPQADRVVGVLRLPNNTGLAWVENARGLLVHIARHRGEQVLLYRIVAPTDWNFHPQGALAAALLGQPVRDEADLKRRAQGLVDSLDPCVACQVDIAHA